MPELARLMQSFSALDNLTIPLQYNDYSYLSLKGFQNRAFRICPVLRYYELNRHNSTFLTVKTPYFKGFTYLGLYHFRSGVVSFASRD